MRTTALAVLTLLGSSLLPSARGICVDGRFELETRSRPSDLPVAATLA